MLCSSEKKIGNSIVKRMLERKVGKFAMPIGRSRVVQIKS